MIRRRLHLVRHGQTTWNTEGRLQGRTVHVPLDDVGRAQADAVAAKLMEEPVAEVVSSDQVRALQTAAVIAAAHGLPVRPDPALRERAFGTWEGRPVEEYVAAVAADPNWIAPGGESEEAVRDRASTFLKMLLSETHRGDIVIVSHREMIRALLAAHTGRPTADFPQEKTSNGTIQTVWIPLVNQST
jgi:probable phosphoglycerate mutase